MAFLCLYFGASQCRYDGESFYHNENLHFSVLFCFFFFSFCMIMQICYLRSPLQLWNMDSACWLWKKDPGFQNQVPGETSPHVLLGAQDQRLRAEEDWVPSLWVHTRTSSGNSQEMETGIVWACHTPRKLPQNRPSRHLGGWALSWLAEEMLMDNIKEWTSLPMPELLTVASLRKDWKKISAELSLMPPSYPGDPISQGTKLN